MTNIYFNKAIVCFLSKIILKKLSNDHITKFRKLEKTMKNKSKIEADLKFLYFCSDNQLLPKFVNFKLYDVSAEHDNETLNFKRDLLLREIRNKEYNLIALCKESIKCVFDFSRSVKPLYFYASISFVARILAQFESDTLSRHARKLRSLYGAKVYLPENTNAVINISRYKLLPNEDKLLQKGLNFSLIAKPDPLNLKIELEKLYFDVSRHKRSNKILVTNDDDFKIKLKHFAIKSRKDNTKLELTRDEKLAMKDLRNNKDIVIQRPDKGGGVVVMDSEYYSGCLRSIVGDTNKFRQCTPNQTMIAKKKINEVVKSLKLSEPDLAKKLMCIGDFYDGHLYGLPKIHKNPT